MMTILLEVVYGLSLAASVAFFLWGIGSAGMNGIRRSSFGPMMLASGFLFLVAFFLSWIITDSL